MFAALPLRYKMLVFATIVVAVELLFRRFAPDSGAYRRWTAFFKGLGAVSLFMRLRATDPLDRGLLPEPSFWRSHEPNPLGPLAAARHQF